MKLVSDWKRFWRWHSTWIAALLATLPYAWTTMPPDLKAHVPDGWLPYLTGAVFVAFVVGRLRKQP